MINPMTLFHNACLTSDLHNSKLAIIFIVFDNLFNLLYISPVVLGERNVSHHITIFIWSMHVLDHKEPNEAI